MKKRSLFWDNYKGILILLVVFGHFITSYASKLPDSFAKDIYIFIYTFHMPAFIFSSGYFSKSQRSRTPDSLMKLFLYYLVFNTLMAVFAYFYLGSNIKFFTPYYSYWYLLSLITWRAVIGKLSNVRGIVLISLVVTLLMGYSSEFSNVLSLRRTVAFFPFFAAGYLLDKEKVERFLSRRKPWHMALYAIAVAAAAAAAFWATGRFGITEGMCLMGAYGKQTSFFCRVLILLISAAAICGMFLVVPNCEIPLLSKIGRNSLLIYLGHRVVTMLYYKELFTYKTYSYRYLVYGLIAAVLTCAVLGSDKLNQSVTGLIDKTAAALAAPESKNGKLLLTAMVLVAVILLCVCAAPQIIKGLP